MSVRPNPAMCWSVTLRDLNAQTMLTLLPGMDHDLLWSARQALASARPPQEPVSTWQSAWNSVTVATEHRPGLLTFYAYVRCPTCHGRRFDPRTGRACLPCIARGNTHTQVRQVARYASPQEPQTSAPTT